MSFSLVQVDAVVKILVLHDQRAGYFSFIGRITGLDRR